MSLGSEVGGKAGIAGHRHDQPSAFSSEFIPYLLSTADAFVILISSILGGVAYQLAIGNEMPNILPHVAVGLLASFIYILRISGTGHYDFPESAKPRVEIANILVYWFTTGLLLAFFAFLLKIGVAYSRGAFVLCYFLRLSVYSACARRQRSRSRRRCPTARSVAGTLCLSATLMK